MFYLTAKFQKNPMNGLENISGRKYGRTYGHDSIGLPTFSQEIKIETYGARMPVIQKVFAMKPEIFTL